MERTGCAPRVIGRRTLWNWKQEVGPSGSRRVIRARNSRRLQSNRRRLGGEPTAVGGLPTDGVCRETDGVCRETDGGWRETDGGWRVTDGNGGRRFFLKKNPSTENVPIGRGQERMCPGPCDCRAGEGCSGRRTLPIRGGGGGWGYATGQRIPKTEMGRRAHIASVHTFPLFRAFCPTLIRLNGQATWIVCLGNPSGLAGVWRRRRLVLPWGFFIDSKNNEHRDYRHSSPKGHRPDLIDVRPERQTVKRQQSGGGGLVVGFNVPGGLNVPAHCQWTVPPPSPPPHCPRERPQAAHMNGIREDPHILLAMCRRTPWSS